MMDDPTRRWIALDKAHGWHPFTQMRDWCAPGHDPLVIVHGSGSVLRDSLGREYLDGNSSIWTNLHGHNHPRINAAIARQLAAFAHVSFLGLTHPLAAELAAKLVGLWPPGTLTRVFFSDDGSTAIEAALRMAAQYWELCGNPGAVVFWPLRARTTATRKAPRIWAGSRCFDAGWPNRRTRGKAARGWCCGWRTSRSWSRCRWR